MKNARNNDFSDRRASAMQAKAALLNAYHASKINDEPARLARQAERMTIAAAREERRLERERTKRAEAERLMAEAIERQETADAVARVETEAREIAESNRIARVLEDEAARKAERDRRYAARKARQA